MYHETTYEQIRTRRRRRIVAFALALAVIALLRFALTVGNALAREQGAAALRESVLRSAMQCCAIEGSYPSTVAHLEERYGLVINKEAYWVSYEWLGDNVVPSVVVKPR